MRDAIHKLVSRLTKPLPRYLRQREPKAQRAATIAWGRMYFRKAVLACGEREWRHVDYEYPAERRKGTSKNHHRSSGWPEIPYE